MNTIASGLIFDIARDAGMEVRGNGDKRACHCPFHDDKNASAFVSGDRNCFFCSVCTPAGGWSAKHFAEALHLDWDAYLSRQTRTVASVLATKPTFSPADALATCKRAFTLARDDDAVDEERAVYDYLAQRGLAESWEVRAFGILASKPAPHQLIAHWPSRGYRLIAPLYDLAGNVQNIQGRTILGNTPKTLFPANTTAKGTVFADRRGHQLLRGQHAGTIVFGEGLTDMLAMAIASPVPVLCAPGTSMALSAVGPWARDRDVLLALDRDLAGDEAREPVACALFKHGSRRVLNVRWPGGAKDACDVVAQRGVLGLEQFLVRCIERRAA